MFNPGMMGRRGGPSFPGALRFGPRPAGPPGFGVRRGRGLRRRRGRAGAGLHPPGGLGGSPGAGDPMPGGPVPEGPWQGPAPFHPDGLPPAFGQGPGAFGPGSGAAPEAAAPPGVPWGPWESGAGGPGPAGPGPGFPGGFSPGGMNFGGLDTFGPGDSLPWDGTGPVGHAFGLSGPAGPGSLAGPGSPHLPPDRGPNL